MKVVSRTQWSCSRWRPSGRGAAGLGGGCGRGRFEAADAVGDLFEATLPVQAAEVADDAEDLGGVREVNRHLAGYRRGAHDARFGAARALGVFGVLGEVGCWARQRGGGPRPAGWAGWP